jgi:lactoylglutathione lyase
LALAQYGIAMDPLLRGSVGKMHRHGGDDDTAGWPLRPNPSRSAIGRAPRALAIGGGGTYGRSVRATTLNHISIHADDLDESLAFYTSVFGMQRIPSPNFRHPVAWLRLGDQELHLFLRDTPAPQLHHFGLNVDDFEAVYTRAKQLGILDRDAWFSDVYELPDGSVQLYLRDPAGNLIEINWPDATTLDTSVVGEIRKLADDVPQTGDALRATLYPPH